MHTFLSIALANKGSNGDQMEHKRFKLLIHLILSALRSYVEGNQRDLQLRQRKGNITCARAVVSRELLQSCESRPRYSTMSADDDEPDCPSCCCCSKESTDKMYIVSVVGIMAFGYFSYWYL